MTHHEGVIRKAWRDAPAIPACGYLYWSVMPEPLNFLRDSPSAPEYTDGLEHAVYFHNRRNGMVIDGRDHHWNEVYGELKNTRVFIGHDCRLPDRLRLQYSPPLSGKIK